VFTVLPTCKPNQQEALSIKYQSTFIDEHDTIISKKIDRLSMSRYILVRKLTVFNREKYLDSSKKIKTPIKPERVVMITTPARMIWLWCVE
jgi:hypothetical protein